MDQFFVVGLVVLPVVLLLSMVAQAQTRAHYLSHGYSSSGSCSLYKLVSTPMLRLMLMPMLRLMLRLVFHASVLTLVLLVMLTLLSMHAHVVALALLLSHGPLR